MHLAGCLAVVAVSSSFTLPNQPANGVVTQVPLGGDGYTAPFAMYTVVNFATTGDATGGAQTMNMVMDNRYCALLGYASMTSTAPADIDIRWSLVGVLGGTVPLMVRAASIDRISSTVTTATVNDTWLPPAFIMPGADPATLTLAVINTDTLIVQVHAVIFLYNINARQKMPFGILAEPRGGI